jgi:hypothetical protein
MLQQENSQPCLPLAAPTFFSFCFTGGEFSYSLYKMEAPKNHKSKPIITATQKKLVFEATLTLLIFSLGTTWATQKMVRFNPSLDNIFKCYI